MFGKAILRQTLNSSRVACSNQTPVRGFFRLMNAQQRMSGMMIHAAQAGRAFSTNTASIEKSIQKLTKSLDKEIKYENENYSQLDDIETYLNESGFKFSEVENGVQMTLTKTVGDKLVEVQFEAR